MAADSVRPAVSMAGEGFAHKNRHAGLMPVHEFCWAASASWLGCEAS
jgi:hypothetical protein